MKRVIGFLLCCLLLTPATAAYESEPPQDMRTAQSIGSPEDLFYGYMLRLAREEQDTGAFRLQSTGDDTARERLSGMDRLIYDLAEPEILAVAAGRRSSTTFTFSLDQLGLSGEGYTAAQLGVSSIISGNAISSAASNAMQAKVSFDPGKVVDALRADHPYEMYWCGLSYSRGGASLTANNNSGEWRISFKDDHPASLSLSVAAEYRGANQYTLNTGVLNSFGVSSAVSRARAIVEQYAGKSDLEKLLGYKEEICALTEYNTAAAGSSAYGNPWQLIYVFDGNSGTKVVCEGYSKAFQYLCDLSAFEGNVQCRSVSGGMNGGAHMWNLVRLDGANYLVDVTNCDGSSVGAPDRLFLCGASGSVGGGYRVTIPQQTEGNLIYYGSTVTYTYDSDTLALWPSSMLTLSAANYPICTVSYDANGGAGRLTAAVADGMLTVSRTEDGANDVYIAYCTVNGEERSLGYQKSGAYGALPAGTTAVRIEPALFGDGNGDRRIDALDATRALRVGASLYTPAEIQALALDVNRDGSVDALDATQMLRAGAGLRDGFAP